ncbi:MAG: SPFH domain-containing protein, partial [Candidatus Promineifilaceae bacterium]
MLSVTAGVLLGIILWFFVRYVLSGFFTVDQNERAVKTSFGKAKRLGDLTTLDDPVSDPLDKKDRDRYVYPLVQVITPGGPYFRWPWEQVHKVSVATETI